VGLESDTPRSAKYRIALRRWTDGVAVNAQRIVAPFAGLSGFGSDKVRVIHNSVRSTPHVAASRRVREELGLGAGEFVIGTVARLARQKRLDRLVRVVAMLPGIHCIVAGDGAARVSLTQLAGELGVTDRMHFLGNREDAHEVLEAIDVFVLTSDSEGLSNAMLEAMSRGRPVVSTNVSGAEDALAPDDQGRMAGIITAFDEKSIASAVSTLQSDARLRESLGAEGKRRIMTQFSRDAMLDAWEDFLSVRPRR
jgi:glycosyltransferase involved in cell wall biosynthesis